MNRQGMPPAGPAGRGDRAGQAPGGGQTAPRDARPAADPVVPIGTATAAHPLAQDAQAAFLGGVAAADPTKLVKGAIRQGLLDDWFGDRTRPRPVHVVALGKAAPRMVWGLVEASVPFTGFGAAVRGVPQPGLDGFVWHTGGHPMPDAGSFAAGDALLDHVARLPPGARVLVLLSGGASACVEVPAVPRPDLLDSWRAWLAAGLPIQELNRRRAGLSRLKAGGLRDALEAAGAQVRAWALADVPADHLDALAGGMLAGADLRVLADNATLVQGAGATLASLGYSVFQAPRRVAGDAATAAAGTVQSLADLDGRVALVAGGEAEVAVPPEAPAGGRCHHAALCAARHLDGRSVFLAGASDGRDGSTGASGAWTDAATWSPAAASALEAHDAFSYLDQRGRSFAVGHTGTNVNDLFVALRGAA